MVFASNGCRDCVRFRWLRSRDPILEALMPPVDKTKADPLTLLLDEIELLSAQTRSLELSLKRAHTDAFEQVERFQQQFRDKLSTLKAEFEDRESSDPGGVRYDGNLPDIENQDLLRRLAEQQNLAQRAHEESERRGAAIVALREQVSRLEATNRQLEQTGAAREIETIRHDAQAKIAALQSEIAHKTALLTQHQATIARLEENLQAISQSSSKKPESLPETAAAEITRRDIEIAELRAAAQHQEKAAADALAHARESLYAHIEALRSELNQKQLLLEQRQSTQNAEQELRNRYRELQGRLAAKESVIESQEYHLRTAQAQLLAAREALGEKERAFAESAARAAEEDRQLHEERNQWQYRLAETQVLAERHRTETEGAKAELAVALERLDRKSVV